MAAPQENGSQNHIVNGVNGDNGRNGGDEFPQELQPSTSGGASEEHALPRLHDLCFRGLAVCRCQFYRLARDFGSGGVVNHTMDAFYRAFTYAEDIILSAMAATSESEWGKWYITVPIQTLMMVTRLGSELVLRYIDTTLPENRVLVRGLHALRITLMSMHQDASAIPAPDVDPELPELTPSSSVSSLSDLEEHPSEEELAQPETPGDKSLYFSVEQLTEQVQGMKVEAEDIGEKSEEKSEEVSEETAQEGKVEEERPATAAEETSGAAKSMDQPQPEPSQPQPQAPADCLVSAEEAERAAMSALPQPSAQPASSQDMLAAEGSSQAKPDTRNPAARDTSKPTKKTLIRSLFRSKKV